MNKQTRAFLVAGLMAVALILGTAARANASTCYPPCAIWNDSNPEWYLFFCYLC